MRLYTSIILLGSSFWTTAGAFNKLEDKKCLTNVTALQCKIGRRAHIAVSMDPFEECYVVFRDPDNYQCCYGPKEVCDAYENGRECLQHNYEYFIHNDPMVTNKTCTLVVESMVKAQAGHYTFFNMDRNKIQECFVEVMDQPSNMISVPRPILIALVVALVFLVIFVTWAVGCGLWAIARLKKKRNQLPGST